MYTNINRSELVSDDEVEKRYLTDPSAIRMQTSRSMADAGISYCLDFAVEMHRSIFDKYPSDIDDMKTMQSIKLEEISQIVNKHRHALMADLIKHGEGEYSEYLDMAKNMIKIPGSKDIVQSFTTCAKRIGELVKELEENLIKANCLLPSQQSAKLKNIQSANRMTRRQPDSLDHTTDTIEAIFNNMATLKLVFSN